MSLRQQWMQLAIQTYLQQARIPTEGEFRTHVSGQGYADSYIKAELTTLRRQVMHWIDQYRLWQKVRLRHPEWEITLDPECYWRAKPYPFSITGRRQQGEVGARTYADLARAISSQSLKR